MSILIQNGYVIPAAKAAHLPRADILVREGRIAAIGVDLLGSPGIGGEGLEIVDASDRLVLPGFVNAHTHSNESFEQGFYDALPLEIWLMHKYPPFALPQLEERAHYLRTMILAIESLRSGVTTVQDDLINQPGDPAAFDGAAAAYRDLGLRASITTSMGDRDMLEPLPWAKDMLDPELHARLATVRARPTADHLALFERNFDKWSGTANDRLRVILGPVGPQWCSDALMQAATEISLARGISVHTHTLESKTHAVQADQIYGKPLVEHLDDIGVLTPNFTLNHAVWLTDPEIALLGERGSCMTHNPLSNLKLGAGIARIPDLLAAGVPIGLGTDGTSTSDRADMFRSLALAAVTHRAGEMDHTRWPTAEDAFAMATTGAARTAMLGDDIGTLEVGKKADIILIDRSDYGLIPLHKPVQQLTYAVNSEAVRTVLVDGVVVMRERELTMIDERAMKNEIREAAEDYLKVHVPRMEEAAKPWDPYWKAFQLRVAHTAVPASSAPVRLPCGCTVAMPHTKTPFACG
ncbi:amidohydrolase [Breoghania sp. L-A4]|uniref:amidohydrolase n=1 Tax=Breoghania sp. L-A4 TaxID=2304600 RepID=UPI0013C34680|nr:amidohydrolase [Breoghania sp. L-A4]